jgi:hypothetical protein
LQASETPLKAVQNRVCEKIWFLKIIFAKPFN